MRHVRCSRRHYTVSPGGVKCLALRAEGRGGDDHRVDHPDGQSRRTDRYHGTHSRRGGGERGAGWYLRRVPATHHCRPDAERELGSRRAGRRRAHPGGARAAAVGLPPRRGKLASPRKGDAAGVLRHGADPCRGSGAGILAGRLPRRV